MNIPKEKQLKATYAALYALGITVPPEGIALSLLAGGLAGHLDDDTLQGLLKELERRKVIRVSGIPLFIERDKEYLDGLERLRLAGLSVQQA